ncbi:MAG TPA: cupin domain-containing protein [Acetobacteraceae bacterium]|nr:cupin domain-containing protein [Acetobacteraceae bacterium]
MARTATTRKAARKATAVRKSNKAGKPKTAAAKRIAKQPPARPARRRAKAAAKPALSARKQGKQSKQGKQGKQGKQRFTVSHHQEADFKADGLRSYALYRDLGIAAATSGLCQAHVIRFLGPCTDEVRKRHYHETELQLIYVLKGWMKNEFEGHGEQLMQAGSCWVQPPGIEHMVLDFSDDLEVLEIIVPADFKTVELVP